VLLVGNPNVGKSALFNKLTGQYVTVSNYPGTTVEVSHGDAVRCNSVKASMSKSWTRPGMYSLLPITDEERVASDMLSSRAMSACVVHVVDAKNLDRMLGFTLQAIESGLPRHPRPEHDGRGEGRWASSIDHRQELAAGGWAYPVIPTVVAHRARVWPP
jgi:Fe2+ transport system protein B